MQTESLSSYTSKPLKSADRNPNNRTKKKKNTTTHPMSRLRYCDAAKKRATLRIDVDACLRIQERSPLSKPSTLHNYRNSGYPKTDRHTEALPIRSLLLATLATLHANIELYIA